MATDDDLLTYLALGDAQKKLIAANDPYSEPAQLALDLGGTIAKMGPEYKTRDKIVGALISGMLGGGLGTLSEDYQDRASDDYRSILGDLILNKQVNKPDTLSSKLFQAAKEQSSLFKYKQILDAKQLQSEIDKATKIEEAKGKVQLQNRLLELAATDPRAARRLGSLFTADPNAIATTVEASPQVDTLKPAPTAAETPAPSIFAKSPKIDPVKRYEELLNSDMDEGTAKLVLDKELERENKKEESAQKQIDELLLPQKQSLRDTEDSLNNLKYSLSRAGQTGSQYPGQATGRSLNLGVQSLFGIADPERIGARADLNSQALNLAAQIRKMFPGATSNKEMEMYMSAVPNTGKLPEENKAIFDRMERAFTLGKQRVKFIENAVSRGASLPEAESLYDKLENVVPTFKDGEINPDRMSLDVDSIPYEDLAIGNIIANPITEKDSVLLLPESKEAQTLAETGKVNTGGAGPSLFEQGRNLGKNLWKATALAANTASLGVPEYIVGAGETALEEGKDILGIGANRSPKENFQLSLKKTDEALKGAKKDLGILGVAAEVGGAVASPINKLKAVKTAYEMGGVSGIFARATVNAAQNAIAGKEGTVNDRIKEAGMLSMVMDMFGKGVSKAAPLAQSTFNKAIGLTSESYRRVAKGLRKTDIGEAKNVFNRAINIVKKEEGLNLASLIKGDESVLEDIASKSINAIEKRQDDVQKIVDLADQAMSMQGAVIKPKNIKISFAAKNRGADKAGTAFKGDFIKEYDEIMGKIKTSWKKKGGVTLQDIMDEKRALNPFYKADPVAKDAVSAVRDDLMITIQNTVDDLVNKKVLKSEWVSALPSLQKESRDLYSLRDAMLQKLPGAQAKDFIESLVPARGSTGIRGLEALGSAAAGDAGGTAGVIAALSAYSNRLKRPIASMIADGTIEDFLNSPEARAAATSVYNQSEAGNAGVDFSANMARPNVQRTQELFGKKKVVNEPIVSNKKATLDKVALTKMPLNDVLALIETDPVDATVLSMEAAINPKTGKADPRSNNPDSTADGLFQLIDSTAKSLGVEDKYNPGQNYYGYKKLRAENEQRFGSDPLTIYAGHFLGGTLLAKVLANEKISFDDQMKVNYFNKILAPKFNKIYSQKVTPRVEEV